MNDSLKGAENKPSYSRLIQGPAETQVVSEEYGLRERYSVVVVFVFYRAGLFFPLFISYHSITGFIGKV